MAFNQQQWNPQGNAALAAIQQSKASRQQPQMIPQSLYGSASPQQQQQPQAGYGQRQQGGYQSPQSYSSPRQQPNQQQAGGYGQPFVVPQQQQQHQQQQSYHGMQSQQQQQPRPHQHHHHHHHHQHQHHHQHHHARHQQHHQHHQHQHQHHQHQHQHQHQHHHQHQQAQNWSGRGQPQQQFRQQHPQQPYQTPAPTKTPQQKKLEEVQSILRSQEEHHKKCMDYANMLKEQKEAQSAVAKSLLEQNDKLDNIEKELTEREKKLVTYEETMENVERLKLDTQKEKLDVIKKQLDLANSKAALFTARMPYQASFPCDLSKKKIGARELKLAYPDVAAPPSLKYIERVCEGNGTVALTNFTVQTPENDDDKLITTAVTADGTEQPPITIRLLLLEKNTHRDLTYNVWGHNDKDNKFSLFSEGWMTGDGDITDPVVHNKIAWRALVKAGITDSDFNYDVEFSTLCKVVEDEQTTYYILPCFESLGTCLGWSQDATTKSYSVTLKPTYETSEATEPLCTPSCMRLSKTLAPQFTKKNFPTGIAGILINEQVRMKTGKQLRESLASLPPVEVEKKESPQKEKRDRDTKEEEDANLPNDDDDKSADEDAQDEKKTKTETPSGAIIPTSITYNCVVKTTVQDGLTNISALRPFRNLDVPSKRNLKRNQQSVEPSGVVRVNDLVNHLINSAAPDETLQDYFDLVARIGLDVTNVTSKPYRPYFITSDATSNVEKSKPKPTSVELF